MRLLIRLLFLTLVVAAVCAGCKKEESVDLVVVSPHSKFTETEFTGAFERWHEAKYGSVVNVQWRDVGGTTQITGYIKAQYEASDSCGIDIFFGGGSPAHEDLARRDMLVPIELPAEITAQIPESIGGVRQYDAEHRWYGACLSSFGILYNAKLAGQKGVPAPATWDDLAHPRMVNLVCTAGPKSGSARAAYELILQSSPDWPTGWTRLLSFWGNCKSFTEGASDVPSQVADGEVVAGTCIGYYAANAIASSSSGILRYALPVESAAFTPDPISILKGAPNAEMAQRFVEFVLSGEGQALWCLPAGAEGGPTDHSLYRQPIRKDTYQKHSGAMLDGLVDVYSLPGGFTVDAEVQSLRIPHILPPLMRAAAMDNAAELRRAWRVIVAKGRPDDLMAEFTALPDDLATEEAMLATARRLAAMGAANDDAGRRTIESAWRAFFSAKYKAIIAQQ